MLAELEKEFEGELKVEFIDVSTLPPEESESIMTVPMYKLFDSKGNLFELWTGTKDKEAIEQLIDCALENDE
jgi:hypothetical protein